MPVEPKPARNSSPIERVIFASDLPYLELVQAFEAQLGVYDYPTGEQLVLGEAPWPEVEETIGRMQGPHGMMLFYRVDLGATASLKGERLQCTLFIIGNPLIATQIVAHDIRAGLLVPFGVQVYSDGGDGLISYNRPSSFLGSLGNPEIDKIALGLDAKIEAAIKAIS